MKALCDKCRSFSDLILKNARLFLEMRKKLDELVRKALQMDSVLFRYTALCLSVWQKETPSPKQANGTKALQMDSILIHYTALCLSVWQK